MCRNIKMLFNFAPPATEEEIKASALQFVRKLSGFNAPSKINEVASIALSNKSATRRAAYGLSGYPVSVTRSRD